MENIICNCKVVSEHEIVKSIRKNNAKTVEEIQRITDASTGCGRCKRNIKYILERELKSNNPN